MSEFTDGGCCAIRKGWARSLGAAALFALVSADPASAFEWTRYVDPGNGMSITYPRDLFPTATRTEEGVQLSGDDAELEILARADVRVNTADELRDLMMSVESYSSLTYSPSGKSWLVASGYRGEAIYYEKFFLLNGEVRAFSIQYPKAMRSVYDPVVEALEDTFQPW